MKWYVLAVVFFSSSILAETFKSRLHSIEGNLIKFNNGRVAFLGDKNINVPPDEYLEVEVDEHSNLLSLKQISSRQENNFKSFNAQSETNPPLSFEPTIVQGMKEALQIWHRSNPYWKRISECTDRAHIWAHEEFKFSGTKSRKVFVFFTASYINSVRFKWWFHVAPLYSVNDQGKIKELAMDYRYADRPLTVKEWTDLFVYTKRPCKITTKFSDYDGNPSTEDCYLITESMHYRIPAEIHEQELSGRYKTSTNEAEIQAAYRYGFEPKESI